MSAASAALARRPALHVNRNDVLAVVGVAQFMVVLDSTIVIVALPTTKRGLWFSEQSLSWIHNAYTLVFGGFLLLGRRAADRLDRRRLFVAGITLFSGASLICGLAQSEGMRRSLLWPPRSLRRLRSTNPSRLFVLRDGAEWTELEALQDVPSRERWSFPPRPWTHHVLWIAPDPHQRERLLVAIELGGVMLSGDGGESRQELAVTAPIIATALAA